MCRDGLVMWFLVFEIENCEHIVWIAFFLLTRNWNSSLIWNFALKMYRESVQATETVHEMRRILRRTFSDQFEERRFSRMNPMALRTPFMSPKSATTDEAKRGFLFRISSQVH